MVAIDLSDGIGCAVREESIEVLNLGLPFFVRSELSFGEHEGFSGVEALIDDRQVCIIASDLKDARQSVEVECRSAGFEDEAMGGDEERRFADNR